MEIFSRWIAIVPVRISQENLGIASIASITLVSFQRKRRLRPDGRGDELMIKKEFMKVKEDVPL